jgi:hypothetical protein
MILTLFFSLQINKWDYRNLTYSSSGVTQQGSEELPTVYRAFPVSTYHSIPPHSYIVEITDRSRPSDIDIGVTSPLPVRPASSSNYRFSLTSMSAGSSTERGILQLLNPFLVLKSDPVKHQHSMSLPAGALGGITNTTAAPLVNNPSSDCVMFFRIHDWNIIDDEEVSR